MRGTKITIVLAFLLSVTSLAGVWVLRQRLVGEKQAREKIESKLVQSEEHNQDLESQVARINQYEEELERLRGQLKSYVDQRDELKKELDGSYGQIAVLKKQIQTLQSESETLKNQLNVGQVTDDAITREAAKIAVLPAVPPTQAPTTSEIKQAVAKAETKSSKDKKETKTTKPEEKKPAEKPKTPAFEEPQDQRPLQVLSVNRQFKFVVVNVGIRGKLKIGDVLRVEQNGKLIGRVQVEKLYENFSACNIVEEIKPAQIREGDLVRVA